MGIEKIGVKIFSPVAEKFVQKFGARSILQTKQPIFHGINPTLTYAPSGKTFALPRFCTQEMEQARQMNKIAIHQAKAGDVVKTYPKATAQDLKRLTSETIEDSYSRVEWTNPKDGKVYNLLKQGETEDGKVIVRILDQEGAFIKEANLEPLEHIMIDDSRISVLSDGCNNKYIPEIEKMSHFDFMKIGAKRTNPFEKIMFYDVNSPCIDGKCDVDKRGIEIYKEIINDIDSGKINPRYVSMSRGIDHKIDESLSGFSLKELTSFKDFVSKLQKRGIRILVSAGNSGKSFQSVQLINTGAEGVGALQHGKIASYSASRNSQFTQHYEESAFDTIIDEAGNVNITGIPGSDFSLKNNFLLGRTEKDFNIQIQELLNYKKVLRDRYLALRKEGKLTQGMINNYRYKLELIDSIYEKLGHQRCNLIIKNGKFVPKETHFDGHGGTSLATAIRTAKLALNDMMQGVV